MNLQKQLRCVYLHAFFSTLRFTDAVWVALLAARGFSLAEIGLAEGMFHLTSLLCEVPSGMAADLLGRRRTLIFGGVLGVFSALAMASAPGLGLICTAMALKALGYNMLSGTAEALIYDSLKMAGREKDYIKVDANASICMKIATALGSLASLLAGVLRYAGYYLADAVSALLSALAAARLEEPIVTDEQAARERHTLRELPARLRVHILDRLTEQGGAMEWLFLPGLLAGAAGMAGAALGRRLHPKTLRGLYLACALTIGAGALLAGAAPAWACAVGPMLVQGALAVWFLHSMQRMNESISSDRRATLISVDSMTYSLLMIPASPMLGWLGDAAGSAGVGLCLLGAMVAASGLAVAAKTRYNTRGA